jgi:hypothetical protein
MLPGHCSSIILVHIYTCCMHHGFGMNPQIKHMNRSSTFMHVPYFLAHFNKMTFASLLFHALQTSMFHSFCRRFYSRYPNGICHTNVFSSSLMCDLEGPFVHPLFFKFYDLKRSKDLLKLCILKKN